MSDLGDLFNAPLIEDVDGFVTASTITDLANTLDITFDKVEEAIGNIYGLSLVNDEQERFINNVSSSIGTSANEYVVPSDVTFTDYTQVFTTNTNKTFQLDLTPITSLLIDDGTHTPSYWTVKLSTKDLALDTDYCVVGRLLTFYNPPASFSIEYAGTYNAFGNDGYLPNILPNRKLRIASTIAAPTVTNVSANRYRLTIPTSTSNGYDTFQAPLTYNLAAHILPYVNPLGTTECPSQYISIWHKVGSKFKRVESSAIYIISTTQYEFVTLESTPLIDEYAVVLSNRSILDDISAIVKTLINHAHNSEDGTATISHASLNDLIPVSENADIKYAGSVLPENHHPQYIHREGYTNDPGTYNNAMLGDLLFASLNSDSAFNNILANSRKIFFGSTSVGHSIYRRAANQDLHLASSANGLTISYDDSDIDNYGLNIAGHKFLNDASDLIINAASGETYFQNQLGDLQNIHLADLYAQIAHISDIVEIAANGELKLGNITIAHSGTDITISGTNPSDKTIVNTPCEIATANITNLNVVDLSLTGGDKIKFLPAVGIIETYFATQTGGGALFNSAKPLAFTGIGKNTGISFTNSAVTETYNNIYVASETGLQPTITDHNTYFESGVQDVYFLQDTTSDKTVDGTLYSWNNNLTTGTNVTNLKNWPRANTFANTVNGNRFKLSQYNSISTTGNAQGINSNKTIIHADNGVLFSRDQSSDYATAAGNKANIEAEAITLNDISSVNGSIESLEVDTLNISSGGGLIVGGETTFNGSVTFNNTLDLNDDVIINANLKVLNNITGADNDGNLTISAGGLLTIIKNTQHFGTTIFANEVTFNSPVESNSLITANAGINANNIEVTNTLDVTGTANINNLNIEDLDATTVNCENINATSNTVASEFKNVNVAGDLVVDQDITMASGKTLNMAGATITNLAMSISPSGTDGVNKQYVDDAVANIGTVNLLKIIWPVNSVYISSHNPSSPGEITGPFGSLAFGTWEAYAQGRVLLGSGTGTDDNGVSRTYTAPAAEGEYVHTQTIDEMANHQHKIKAHPNFVSNSGDADPWDIFVQNWEEVIGGQSEYTGEPLGASQPFNIMQPFMTVYVWRRTA